MLVAIDAAPLEDQALQKAIEKLDNAGDGYIRTDVFIQWFRDDTQAVQKAGPGVHPSVQAGLKEDGDLGGPGLHYDPTLIRTDVPRENSEPASAPLSAAGLNVPEATPCWSPPKDY